MKIFQKTKPQVPVNSDFHFFPTSMRTVGTYLCGRTEQIYVRGNAKLCKVFCYVYNCEIWLVFCAECRDSSAETDPA